MNDKSVVMRELLAAQGIHLADEKPVRRVTKAVAVEIDDVERDRFREIIISAGALGRDVEWLTQSCPSYRHAMSYRPPPPMDDPE
ncbi:MAG: hypothetical protein ABIQ16_18780 [Polyangiaceae bacterium]